LALGVGVALRIAALAALSPWAGAAVLIAAHAAARAAPSFVMLKLSYSGDVAAMKVPYVQSRPRADELLFVLVVTAAAAVPLALISVISIAAGWICGAALAAALAAWSRRLIGGYTGDVLGAIEQMFEIGFLLGAAAVLG
jgi:adenosylcobinamide-GDP ribazoletransferase